MIKKKEKRIAAVNEFVVFVVFAIFVVIGVCFYLRYLLWRWRGSSSSKGKGKGRALCGRGL